MIEIDYNESENRLRVVGKIVLALGIVSSLVLLYYAFMADYRFSPDYLILSVSSLISSIIVWAVLLGMADMGKSKREILEKVKYVEYFMREQERKMDI